MATNRLVIYRIGSLGDTIVALPCFHKIAEAFPDHERFVLTNVPATSKWSTIESILRNSGLIHGSVEYPIGMRSPARLFSLGLRLRSLGASTLVYLAEPRGAATIVRDYFYFRLCGFRRIIGIPLRRDLRRNRRRGGGREVELECQRLARTMAPLGPIDLGDRGNWDLRLTGQEIAEAAELLAPLEGTPFIAVHMGCKWPANDWGDGNWMALFDELAPDFGHLAVVAVGGSDDRPRGERIKEHWRGRVLNLAGRLNPRQTGAVLTFAALFVGHDSGPMHLASAVGSPLVALFSTRSPDNKWYPFLGDARILQSTGAADLIPVEECARAVRACLAALPAAGGRSE